MWILLAFVSATLLGLYDTSKKFSLRGNDVIPVLFLNTLFCSAIFLPLIVIVTIYPCTRFQYLSCRNWWMGDAPMDHTKERYCTPFLGIRLFCDCSIALDDSWSNNATRPVMTLVGAMLVFGERLNAWQWVGVSLAIISLFLLARSGKREGIDFKHNKWIFFLVLAAMMGNMQWTA